MKMFLSIRLLHFNQDNTKSKRIKTIIIKTITIIVTYDGFFLKNKTFSLKKIQKS